MVNITTEKVSINAGAVLLLEKLSEVNDSLNGLKAFITYFHERITDSEYEKPVIDVELREEIKTKLETVKTVFGAKNLGVIKTSIRNLNTAISPSTPLVKSGIQNIWVMFMEFEQSANLINLIGKCDSRLAALGKNKLAPFHLDDLLEEIKKVAVKLADLMVLTKNLKSNLSKAA